MPQAQNNNNGGNGFVWVQGESAAKSYPVAPNTTVLLLDSEGDRFYLKSADGSGMPLPLRIFTFKEITNDNQTDFNNGHTDDYVTRSEFEKLSTKGYVVHRNESGIVTLRGIVNNPCATFARYQVTFNGNIAVPTGGTAGQIAVGIAVSGEAIQTSTAIFTPAAVDQYGNVTSTAIITVPKGCCFNVAIENLSEDTAINVQNANLVVSRIA